MKNNDVYEKIHVGRIIKDIARQRHVASGILAQAITRYQRNADKMFRLEDMYVHDVVRISYALEYNILEMLSNDYMNHLPLIEYKHEHECYSITLDLQTKHCIIKQNAGNCDFLTDIKIGKHIRRIVEKIGWSAKYLANRLNCAPNTISDLYKMETLKLKRLFRISNALGHNLIADVYLSKMCIVSDIELLKQCRITINAQKIHIINPKDSTFSMVFLRQED